MEHVGFQAALTWAEATELSIDLAVGKALLIGTKTSLSFILAVIFGTSPLQRLVLLYAIFHPCL